MVIDPGVWEQPDMRTALAAHDIGEVYRALTRLGISQRQIATLVGQSQSEVSEIIKGRVVKEYAVLVRIADGLGVPREYMGLSYGDNGPYSGEVPVADPEGVEALLRRHFEHLLALAAASAFGSPVKGIGEVADWLTAPPLPAAASLRIGLTDVEMIRRCGEQVGALARACGGQGRAAVRLVAWAEQWLDATCTEDVRRALLSTLSHMHTVTAWCCHDSGTITRAHWHFGRAVELATEAGDSYGAAYAMRHTGMMLVDRGQPNNALKLLQLGIVRLGDIKAHDGQTRCSRSECHVVSALALSQMDRGRQALDELKAARDGWTPPTEHVQGCMDLDSAHTYLRIGRLDTAEAMAAISARTLTASGDRREGVLAELAVARVHVQAGEPGGLEKARSAIRAVADTPSAIARQCWLPPLADALDTQPGTDARDLARQARQVAETRA
jgi:transcriptional regulator with XRE-family HTH domain